MIPPAFIYVKTGRKGRMGFWIPVILLWPLIFTLAVLGIPAAGAAELVLRPFGKGKGLFRGAAGAYQVLCAFRRLRIDVRNASETVSIRII